MNIRKVLSNIYDFFVSSRRSGTTTLIKKIASENDVWVLVLNQEHKKEFGEKAISIEYLKDTKGRNPKPILIDNHTLIKLAEYSIIEIQSLDLEIEKRNKFIRKISDDIEEFERKNRLT